MSGNTRDELAKALLAMRGSPSFLDFVKTLSRRHASVVAQWESGDGSQSEVLRGEARAYTYLIKAATTQET